jgi:pimeloyl-ACP methyl ester carboxylesterase
MLLVFASAIILVLLYRIMNPENRELDEAVGKQKKSVLLIWGSRDTEIPEEVINTARKLIPHVQFHALQDAGHNIVFQKPEQTSAILIGFLRSNK